MLLAQLVHQLLDTLLHLAVLLDEHFLRLAVELLREDELSIELCDLQVLVFHGVCYGDQALLQTFNNHFLLRF